MKNKEIKTVLENQEVEFNIKGQNNYTYTEKDDSWGWVPKLFKTFKQPGKPVASITDKYGISGMNVQKFGPTSFTIYTFDLMGKQTRARIKYEDITILK